MAIGIGIGIPFRRNTNTQIPFESDLNLLASTRDGLDIIDTIGTNNLKILPTYLDKDNTSCYMYVEDNGELSVKTSDITLIARVKGTFASQNATADIAGKAVIGTKEGKYYLYTGSDGTYRFTAHPSDGLKSITSTISAKDLTWRFLLAEIDQTAKVIRFFIDGIQIGSDVSFTGTFADLGTGYPFCVGAGSVTAGNGFGAVQRIGIADVYLFNKLLTPEEKTALQAGGYVGGATLHYPMIGSSGSYCWNAASDNYHLTIANAEIITDRKLFFKYDENGSRYALDKGYTLYENGQGYSYIPYKLDGNKLTNPPIPAGAIKISEHVGNSAKHNLANSLIVMDNAHWDRSNTTIWSDAARGSETFYNASIPTAWHPSELNNLRFNAWANTDYKAKGFVKITDHSYKSRLVLDEILTYTTDHYSSGYNSIIQDYCKDYNPIDGIYESDFAYWRYDSSNINAIKDLKVLKFASGTLYLSLDGGLTYGISKAVSGLNEVVYSKIFENGNIAFASYLKMYISTDNLATVSEVVPTGIDGNPFVATKDSYFCVAPDKWSVINDVELTIIGTYSLETATENVNINAFYTIDNGVSWKSCFKFNTTLPDYDARHIHQITYNEQDGLFYMITGDGQLTCNVYSGAYDFDLDTWTWTHLYGDYSETFTVSAFNGSYYKMGGIWFKGNNVYWGCDANNKTRQGVIKSTLVGLGDSANFIMLYPTVEQCQGALHQSNGIVTVNANLPNTLYTSKNDGETFNRLTLFGLPANTGLLVGREINSNGWMIQSLIDTAEADYIATKGGVVWIKLK